MLGTPTPPALLFLVGRSFSYDITRQPKPALAAEEMPSALTRFVEVFTLLPGISSR